MKIAVFTDSFLPGTGGTENAVLWFCRGAKENGHEIILFAPDYHKGKDTEEFRVCRLKSVKVTYNDMAVLPGLEYGRVKKIIKDFSPDILYYCTAMGTTKLALRVGKKLGIPVVGTIHTKFKDSYFESTHSRFIANCVVKSLVSKLNRSDGVTTVSEAMKRELFGYGYKGETEVIKNGVLRKIEKLPGEKRMSAEPKFIFCGHLYKVKNIQFSIKCLGALKRENRLKRFTFTLVGDGGYEKELKELAVKEGIEENVIFTGLVSDREELNRLYRSSDLMLFPSVFDTDGLVVLEAASNGVPTLAFKNCGASERITDEVNGFLSEMSEKAFADKICEIVENGEAYMRVSANVHTVTAKPWREVVEEYTDFFEKVIEKKNG